jgi:hypothetical protein
MGLSCNSEVPDCVDLSLSSLKIAKLAFDRLYEKYEKTLDAVISGSLSCEEHCEFHSMITFVVEVAREHGQYLKRVSCTQRNPFMSVTKKSPGGVMLSFAENQNARQDSKTRDKHKQMLAKMKEMECRRNFSKEYSSEPLIMACHINYTCVTGTKSLGGGSGRVREIDPWITVHMGELPSATDLVKFMKDVMTVSPRMLKAFESGDTSFGPDMIQDEDGRNIRICVCSDTQKFINMAYPDPDSVHGGQVIRNEPVEVIARNAAVSHGTNNKRGSQGSTAVSANRKRSVGSVSTPASASKRKKLTVRLSSRKAVAEAKQFAKGVASSKTEKLKSKQVPNDTLSCIGTRERGVTTRSQANLSKKKSRLVLPMQVCCDMMCPMSKQPADVFCLNPSCKRSCHRGQVCCYTDLAGFSICAECYKNGYNRNAACGLLDACRGKQLENQSIAMMKCDNCGLMVHTVSCCIRDGGFCRCIKCSVSNVSRSVSANPTMPYGQKGQSKKQSVDKTQEMCLARQASESDIIGNTQEGQFEKHSADKTQKIHVTRHASKPETVGDSDTIHGKKPAFNEDIALESQALGLQRFSCDDDLVLSSSFDDIDALSSQLGFNFGPSPLSSNTSNVAHTPAGFTQKPDDASQLERGINTPYHRITPTFAVRHANDSGKESQKFLSSVVSTDAKSVRIIVDGKDFCENTRVLPFEVPTTAVEDALQEGLTERANMHMTPCANPCRLEDKLCLQASDTQFSGQTDKKDMSITTANSSGTTAVCSTDSKVDSKLSGRTGKEDAGLTKDTNDMQTSDVTNTVDGNVANSLGALSGLTNGIVATKTDLATDTPAVPTNNTQTSVVTNSAGKNVACTPDAAAQPTNDTQSKESENSEAGCKNPFLSYFYSLLKGDQQ